MPGPHAPLFDTHCHVDLFSDPTAVLRRIEAAGVFTIAVTNTPSVFDHLAGLVGNSRYVRVALGLHPELAAARVRELPLFERRLPATRYVGEIGLDYVTPDRTERAIQRRVLDSIIGWCDAAGGKIATVHSRRAADDVVAAFGASFRGTYILHWYSGGAKALRRALANGAYISVNSAMTHSSRGRSLLAEVPRERVLTETDGPFVESRSGPAEPPDVLHAVEGLARLWDVTTEEARSVLYANFSRVVRATVSPSVFANDPTGLN